VRHSLSLFRYLLLLPACSRAPDTFTPPIQRRPLTGPEVHLGPFINMNDLAADAYIVRDISRNVEVNAWRWALAHPSLRFYLRGPANWKYAMDASIPPATFQETGPVTLSIRINDQDFDKLRFDQPGDRHFEKPVPPQFLRPGGENFVSIESDKHWVSKEDGATLTFVLIRAGFIK
jgi:hypothetical protein